MDRLRSHINEIAGRHGISSVSLTVRRDGSEWFHHTTGLARIAPPRPAVEDQAYDLASVTKVLAGTAVAASLVDEGLLTDDTEVRTVLPEVPAGITLAHLLQHASGYPAWTPFYEQVAPAMWGTAVARAKVLAAARTTPLEAAPGTRHTYSDIGFLVLLELLETVGGAPLDVLFHQRVRVPSGVDDLRWHWPQAAATEWPCPVRQVGIEGTVHDLNCASIGGVSTHAGLFGTARAVAALGEAFLDAAAGRGRPGLPGRTLARWWTTTGVGHHRIGWDGISEGYSSTGHHFPRDTIGHLGYTGTSIWMSPSRRVVVALLTNRVHPTDDKAPIRAARPEIHDAIARALGWDKE